MIEDLWYKNAVVYCLDVETFQDGNGDGVGDFRGLKRRLDYLAGLGVTCVWLLPFYPSPNRDNGYDITDYYGVDPRLGDLGDFVAFTHAARSHGIRVIVDLVVNHTSDRHPWFQAARSDPQSPFRDYYVWSKKKPKGMHEGMVFPGVQPSTWTYDKQAKEYYFHRFFDFQPDLNVTHPSVREEIFKIMGFWLQLGVSGFRVDAVPFVVEYKGLENPPPGDPHLLLRDLREFLSWRQGDAILLAEANVTMPEVKKFFGDGDRMQLVFNFQANQGFFAGIVQEDATLVAKALRTSPPMRETSQWANFMRNHDELDLGRLPPKVRAQVFQALGPEPTMQLYDRGLRRRLAPMFGGDPRKLRLAYSLMFSLPGTPVLWYGEEIGMGELLSLKERQAVRTPMHWTDEHHGGFTTADKPVKPMVARGPYSYRLVNVADQRTDQDSQLNWMERLIRLRKECPEIGWGDWKVLNAGNKAVLALRHTWRGSTMISLHNFSQRPLTVRFPSTQRPEDATTLVDLFQPEVLMPEEDGRHRVTLEGYGFRWFRLGGRDSVPQRSAEPEP